MLWCVSRIGSSLSNVRENLKVNHGRCPYCHDEIVPGEVNRPCVECLTWHHSECWDAHGQCVGCGSNRVDHSNGLASRSLPLVQDGNTNVQIIGSNNIITVGKTKEPLCPVHTPSQISDEAMQDLRELWGRDLPCVCPRSKNTEFLKLVSTVGARLKEHEDMRRAEQGPQKEPPCAHKFDPMNMCCRYCHKSELEIHNESYGTKDNYDRLAWATERFGADAVMDSFKVTNGESRCQQQDVGGRDSVGFYVFCAFSILAMLIGALHSYLQQGGM